MRVIAGSARGRTLIAPKGLSTRPMMDIVKGSLFNMLRTMDGIEGRCLDLYAGSGSLGIEALSRGAEFVDFIEQDRAACEVIEANLERLGFADRARVLTKATESFLASAGTHSPAYDLVFVDAPYAEHVSLKILSLLSASPVLTVEALICVGHHAHEDLPDETEKLTRLKFRRFGASCLSIYGLTSSLESAVDEASSSPNLEMDS